MKIRVANVLFLAQKYAEVYEEELLRSVSTFESYYYINLNFIPFFQSKVTEHLVDNLRFSFQYYEYHE